MADEKSSLGQLIDSVRETIRQKWEEMNAHLPTSAERKALRTEISDAVAGLGKTVKQYDPRGRKRAKKAAAKKSASKKSASKKAGKKRPTSKRGR